MKASNNSPTHFGYCPDTAFLPVQPYCVNARLHRCQEDLSNFPFGQLEETTRMASYYVDEDYPAEPEIQQPQHLVVQVKRRRKPISSGL